MVKKLLTSLSVVAVLSTSLVAADEKTDLVSQNAVVKANNNAIAKNVVVKEAVKALKYTEDALIYLNKKQIEKAREALKDAVGQLAIVLNRENAPLLLPVDISVSMYDYIGDIKNIKTQVSLAKKLLKENNLPQAREVLNALRSEIDINAVNIPLATYPDALKTAIAYINANKIKEAKAILAVTLNTLVNTTTIIPIPFEKAMALVDKASKIVHTNKKQALRYLEEAKHQLELAQALGYTSISKTTYKDLKTAIYNLEQKIKDNKKTKDIFSDLANKLEEFKQKAVEIFHK